MTLWQRRLFVFADEWCGIVLLCHLRERDDWIFWPVLAGFCVALYLVSYPALWRAERGWS